MISREDTRRDRIRAVKERRDSMAKAAAAWMSARELRQTRQDRGDGTAGQGATVRNITGPVEIIILPLQSRGIEFWLVAAWAAGTTVEYYTRMSESSALRVADGLEKKYTVAPTVSGPSPEEVIELLD